MKQLLIVSLLALTPIASASASLPIYPPSINIPKERTEPLSETMCQGKYYFSPTQTIIGVFYDIDATPYSLHYVTIASNYGREDAETRVVKVIPIRIIKRRNAYILKCEFKLRGYEGWLYKIRFPNTQS